MNEALMWAELIGGAGAIAAVAIFGLMQRRKSDWPPKKQAPQRRTARTTHTVTGA